MTRGVVFDYPVVDRRSVDLWEAWKWAWRADDWRAQVERVCCMALEQGMRALDDDWLPYRRVW